MIVQLAEGHLHTHYGYFKENLYYDGQKEYVALVMGQVQGAENVLCRVHSACLNGHYFNSVECDCREQMEISQQIIQQEGRGIIIWLDQEGKANGFFALLKSKEEEAKGLTQSEAYEAIGFKRDGRDFARVADILRDLGVLSIQMLTNNPKKIETLTRHGIAVSGAVTIQTAGSEHPAFLKTMSGKKSDGHSLST